MGLGAPVLSSQVLIRRKAHTSKLLLRLPTALMSNKKVAEMERNKSEKSIAVDRAFRFGHVNPTEAVAAFGHEMNREIMALLQSLPAATHAAAVVFLMQHFRTPFFPQFDYFRNYHPPSWSIIYWLGRMAADRGVLSSEDDHHSKTAHAMALFLHPLDDHLEDGQLPASHLHVLLRSQAWMKMNEALDRLAARVDGGAEIVTGFINDYYASIGCSPVVETLDGYCHHFRKQMATGMIVPALLAAKLKPGRDFAEGLTAAYGAFGIAWRLMDDLQDMEIDVADSNHSAIYYCLPAGIRLVWDEKSQGKDDGRFEKIRSVVHNIGVWEAIEERMCLELTSASSTMEAIQMTGLAEELRGLARPFTNRPTTS